MIYVDTREKKNEHIIRYFEKNGICYERKKLDVCDIHLEQVYGLNENKISWNWQETLQKKMAEESRRNSKEFRQNLQYMF